MTNGGTSERREREREREIESDETTSKAGDEMQESKHAYGHSERKTLEQIELEDVKHFEKLRVNRWPRDIKDNGERGVDLQVPHYNFELAW